MTQSEHPATRSFQCEHCGGEIRIPYELPPTEAPCPHCEELIESPAPPVETLVETSVKLPVDEDREESKATDESDEEKSRADSDPAAPEAPPVLVDEVVEPEQTAPGHYVQRQRVLIVWRCLYHVCAQRLFGTVVCRQYTFRPVQQCR